MFSFSFELLQQYVDIARIQQEFPTADGYFQWIPHRPEMHKFLSDAVFGYCLALHVFRASIRRNNSDAFNVAKAHFAPLFFGLRMPFYMETFFRDSVLRTKCPPELLNFLKNHDSYSVSGQERKGWRFCAWKFQSKRQAAVAIGPTKWARLDQGMQECGENGKSNKKEIACFYFNCIVTHV